MSIHCNAANGQAKGTETFYFQGSIAGKKLATAIQNQLINSLPVINRGVKVAGFYVLKYTAMPAVLVETVFIDNPHDANLLRDREDDFARAIARGISDFYAAPLPDVIDEKR